MNELIKVKVLRDFSKHGVGQDARGFKGDTIEVSPELAEFLSERNLVKVTTARKKRSAKEQE